MRVLEESIGRSRESMATASTAFEEEEKGVLKSGVLTAGFAPVKKKQIFYVVLCERALELHESEKSWKKKKPPKHLVDLSVAFNVSNDHLDAKLKRCVCLMGPDETLVLKGDTDAVNAEWYDAILSAVIPSRALRLGRPVQTLEFFECAYDVEVVGQPRLKRPVKGEEIPNFANRHKDLQGPRRLCFYAHTIVLCKRQIEPAMTGGPPEGIPPFQIDDFLELQRKFIPNYGSQERYFMMRMGRGSPMGQCELWCLCESDEVASHIHAQLNGIIEREGEKKKKMGNGLSPIVPQIPNLAHRGHRERSHTQPHRARIASLNGSINNESAAVVRERRAQLRDSKALVDSFEEEGRSRPTLPHNVALLDLGSRRNTQSPLAHLGRKHSAGTPSSVSGAAGALSSTASRHSFGGVGTFAGVSGGPCGGPGPLPVFPPQRRQSGVIMEEPALYQPMDAATNSNSAPSTSRSRNDTVSGIAVDWLRGASPSTISNEETEDSGGTLRNNGSPEGSARNLSLIETKAETHFRTAAARGNDSSSGGLLSSEDDDKLSAGTSASTVGSISVADEAYAPMEAADWCGGSQTHLAVPFEQYNLEEVRSYVSSSSDSCYSSIAVAYAAGGGSCGGGGGASTAGLSSTPSGASSVIGGASGGHSHRAFSFAAPSTLLLHRAAATGASPPTSGHHQHHAHKHHTEGAMAEESRGGGASGSSPQAPTAATVSGGQPSGGGGRVIEDPRQRAFSLGSKNFLTRPFRKLSQYSTRARHSATSTSGASLASSAGHSSGGHIPSESVSTNQIAALTSAGGVLGAPSTSAPAGTGAEKEDPYHRNRSGSFGSGRSTPYSRRGANVDKSRDHLVEIDFGSGTGDGVRHIGLRSGSGSIASIDSPSRSRTSSFGCSQVRKDHEIGETEQTMHVPEGMTASQVVLQKARQLSIDVAPADTSDYVITEAASSLAAAARESAEAKTKGSTTSSSSTDSSSASADVASCISSKSHELRTIEENASGRSSRASSRESIPEESDDFDYTMMETGEGSASAQNCAPCPLPVPDVSATSPSPSPSAITATSSASSMSKRSSQAQLAFPMPQRGSSSSLTAPSTSATANTVLPAAAPSSDFRDDSGLNYACLEMPSSSSSNTSSNSPAGSTGGVNPLDPLASRIRHLSGAPSAASGGACALSLSSSSGAASLLPLLHSRLPPPPSPASNADKEESGVEYTLLKPA